MRSSEDLGGRPVEFIHSRSDCRETYLDVIRLRLFLYSNFTHCRIVEAGKAEVKELSRKLKGP